MKIDWEVWQTGRQNPPMGAYETFKYESFIHLSELHNARSLKTLTYPVTLITVINEHVFNSNAAAVRILLKKKKALYVFVQYIDHGNIF